MKIVISEEAKADLIDIRNYIAQDDRDAAKREVARIKAAIALLATNKADGRRLQLSTGQSVRIWLVSSYRLYYRRTDTELHILHVHHHARRFID